MQHTFSTVCYFPLLTRSFFLIPTLPQTLYRPDVYNLHTTLRHAHSTQVLLKAAMRLTNRRRGAARRRFSIPTKETLRSHLTARFRRYLASLSIRRKKPEFAVFRFLPPEIRLKIWKAAANDANHPETQAFLAFEVLEDGLVSTVDSHGIKSEPTLMFRLQPSKIGGIATYSKALRDLATVSCEAAQAIEENFTRFEFDKGYIFFDSKKDFILLEPRDFANNIQAMMLYKPQVLVAGDGENEAFIARAKSLPDCIRRLGLDATKLGAKDGLWGLAMHEYMSRLTTLYLLGHNLDQLLLWNGTHLWARPKGPFRRHYYSRLNPSDRCLPLYRSIKSVALTVNLLRRMVLIKPNPAWNREQNREWLTERTKNIPSLTFLNSTAKRLHKTHVSIYTLPPSRWFQRRVPVHTYRLEASVSWWTIAQDH